MRKRLAFSSAIGCVAFTLAGHLAAQGPPPSGPDRLRAQIERAARAARGDVGVAIKHLESGTEVMLRADEPFPLASVFKLPVLVELYAQARAGRVRFDELVDLRPAHQHLGSGDLSAQFDLPGLQISIRNLANLMMMISDNSAADLLLARVGATSVTTRMRALGLTGIRVDRSAQELILDYGGKDTERLKDMLLQELYPLTLRPYEDEAARLTRDTRLAADPRDQATPREMTRLLELLWRGQAVDADASKAMLELMKRCRTGYARLRGLLPHDTILAHKTGTIGGAINDVGIIYLPDEAGHVAISVLVKRAQATGDEVERVIAEIGRYAYDYFYFAGPATSGLAGVQP